jgi:hypothetical protein
MSEEEKMDSSPRNRSTESPKEANGENSNVNEESLTTNDNSQPKNMEVHHHPDLHHRKKHWKEYFLEFIMIFLAVTMGFFAESLRENINNNERLHNYIQSLASDLKSDLEMYDSSIAFNNSHREMIDSIIMGLNEAKKDLRKVYLMARQLTMGSSVVSPNTKTFEQMKSSGDIRLIRKQFIADSIGMYYQWTKKFGYWSDLQRQRLTEVVDVNDKVFNAFIFFQIIKNPNTLILINQRCYAAMVQDKQLLKVLQKEYDIDE